MWVPFLSQEDSPGGGNGNPFQHSCLGKFHDKRSLVGYSPRGCKELGTTEHMYVCMYVLFHIINTEILFIVHLGEGGGKWQLLSIKS